jgi:hypothetical protein
MRIGEFLFGVGVAVSMVSIATLIILTFTYVVVGPINASQILPSTAEGPTLMSTQRHERANVSRP